MKLNELFDTEDTQSRQAEPLTRQNSADSTGKGMFGYVTSKEDDPHLVTKHSHEPTDEPEKHDKYWAYARFVIDNKLAQSNPYFPRFYKIHKKTDQVDKKINFADMEKLTPLPELSDEELNIIIQRMEIPDRENTYEMEESKFLRVRIVGYVENHLQQGIRTDINDEEYVEAINLLREFRRDIGASWDMHDGNMMARRGKFGIQLVITDPVW